MALVRMRKAVEGMRDLEGVRSVLWNGLPLIAIGSGSN